MLPPLEKALMYFRGMNQAVLLLGSNIGDRKKKLTDTVRMIEEKAGLIMKKSQLYETAPWGNTDQDPFYNQVIVIETILKADELMQVLLQIEIDQGRVRNQKWEPRIIDIDILYFNDEVIREDHLLIPHPLLQERRFVLVPLAEVLPDFVHPVLKINSLRLLERCEDTGVVTAVNDTNRFI
jgi:2-amino-4-hydroxy-6-hydroxymethyldihydropteridine diphosphokinase